MVPPVWCRRLCKRNHLGHSDPKHIFAASELFAVSALCTRRPHRLGNLSGPHADARRPWPNPSEANKEPGFWFEDETTTPRNFLPPLAEWVIETPERPGTGERLGAGSDGKDGPARSALGDVPRQSGVGRTSCASRRPSHDKEPVSRRICQKRSFERLPWKTFSVRLTTSLPVPSHRIPGKRRLRAPTRLTGPRPMPIAPRHPAGLVRPDAPKACP